MQATLFEIQSPIERSVVPVLNSVDYFTDAELIAAKGERLLFDVECYPNYFLVAFKSLSGKVVTFEQSADASIHLPKLEWVLDNFILVGFNSRDYDLPLITLAFRNCNPKFLKDASDYLTSGINPRQFLEDYSLKLPKIDHIDLISVAPLEGSLKVYAGRLHCPRMQDLPYDHTQPLTREQATILKHYCINDLDNTGILLSELEPQLKLRESMSAQYKQDLRSLSDAQLAERIICSELKRLTGRWPKRPENIPTRVKYAAPKFIRFETPELQAVLQMVQDVWFPINGAGSPEMPPELEEKTIVIGEGKYRMGMGGLHSSEESVSYVADESMLIIDRDVASYYPAIKINLELYPKQLGPAYLEVYAGLRDRRLVAKKAGDKMTAESLKIAVNGSFGKLGSMWSALYSPDLMLTVTLTGQLCLLMAIEAIERANIVEVVNGESRRCKVISANTDGIVTLCPASAYETLQELFMEWEATTGFQTEETRYKALYSRDVNNYIALKPDGTTKTKGTYANPWEQPGRNIFKLHKNPQNSICIEAVIAFLRDGIPLEKTIGECKELPKFLTVRNVRGGAHKEGAFLGKVVRWYYSTEVTGALRYINSGNQVPRSQGARQLMDLPTEFPEDINYSWYIAEAICMLIDIGFWDKITAANSVKDQAVMRHLKTQLKKK